MEKSISELRQDIVTGDWVVIATGRGKRPDEFSKQKKSPFVQPKVSCPFENISTSLSKYGYGGGDGDWQVKVISNKYPAFGSGECLVSRGAGPYQWGDAVGFHEVIVSRDHKRSLGQMSDNEAELIVRAYQDRYLALQNQKCVKYISIFHNHGRGAGASISHPHSQLIALPVIPPDVARSIQGSDNYFRAHKTCVHCVMVRYELKAKKRVVYENESFVVVTPFASRSAFELRIFSKQHVSNFEFIKPDERFKLANALRVSLGKIFYGLKNPDFNFFIHTAPAENKKTYANYHWHIEIIPKTAVWAGFEIGTGIEISSIAPEEAAAFLKKIKV